MGCVLLSAVTVVDTAGVGGVVSERRGKLVFEQGLDAGQAEMEVVQIVFVGRQAQATAGPGPNGPNEHIWTS